MSDLVELRRFKSRCHEYYACFTFARIGLANVAAKLAPDPGPLVASAFQASALGEDVTLTLNVTKLSDNRVRLNGRTNLPPGTKLMLSVQEEIENGLLGQSSCFVSANGEFDSEAFGPRGGLKDGRYVAEATMPIPAVQPPVVKEIIGKNGENLSGSLVEKGEFGITVSQQTEFAIGALPDEAQADRKKQTDDATAKLKEQLCVYLEQILEFKDEPKFKQFGFGTSGPYNKWLKNVEALRDSSFRTCPSVTIATSWSSRSCDCCPAAKIREF